MNFQEKKALGRTGLKAGRLGISSSYGAPAEAYEEAFEKGCNYFTLGSFGRGRSKEMIRAIRNITAKGKRDELIVSVVDYTHDPLIGRPHYKRALRQLGLEYADVFFLGYTVGYYRKHLVRWAQRLKDKGLARYIGVSSHDRSLFPVLANEGDLDVFHIRYNPVNTGAEKDIFPVLPQENRQGIVAFTATRWGQLLKESKMPEGEPPLTASDCYRFVLGNPSVDICMTGAKTHAMLTENLKTLEMGSLSEEEMQRIRRIGDHLYGKPRN